MDLTYRSDMTVDLVKSSAADHDVATAARVSTIGGDSKENDKPIEGLINFLMRDRHGSPFEHTSFTFYIEAPIFVAREFMRHRAGWSYNEESGRYKELEPVFYAPDERRKLVQVGKPGAYEFEAGSSDQAVEVGLSFAHACEVAYHEYEHLLEWGVAREVARMVLPVGIYTSFYATCNARSLMHFLSLRTKSQLAKYPSFPQREIEMVAEGMEKHFAEAMPLTWGAFCAHGRVAP
jgi:thymidylate synthase (FAD)